MPWIWSDELASALLRAGLVDQQHVQGLVQRPRAVSSDGRNPLEMLAEFGDDDEGESRRIA